MICSKNNVYQHADIIIDRMIEKSGLSQTKFAEKILGINGVNVSKARRSRKIPAGWFDTVEKKLGVTREELCKPPTNIAATIEPGSPARLKSAENLPVKKITPLKIIVAWLNEAFDGEHGEYEAMIFFDDLKSRWPSFEKFVESRGCVEKANIPAKKEAC